MRSKTKVLQKPVNSMDPKDFPEWSYDGSSTGQAKGNNSDCILRRELARPGSQVELCSLLRPGALTPPPATPRPALAGP